VGSPEHHWTLFSAKRIQSALFHLISLLCILVSFVRLHLVLTNGSFPLGSSSKISYAFFISHVFGTCSACLILIVLIIMRFRTWSKANAGTVLISVSCRNLFLSGRAAQLSAMTLFLHFPSVTCPLLDSAHCYTECGGSMLLQNIGFYLKNYVLPHPYQTKYIYLNFSPPWKHEISMVHALHVRCYTGVLDSWSKVCRILHNVGCAVTIEVTFFWYITPGRRGTSMILS